MQGLELVPIAGPVYPGGGPGGGGRGITPVEGSEPGDQQCPH